MDEDKWKFCSRCGFFISCHDTIKVTSSGKIYCYKNNCAYGVPEKETVIVKGSPELIFCRKCGGIIPVERRALDKDGKYFCSSECELGTCVCCKCGCKIENGVPHFKVPESAIE